MLTNYTVETILNTYVLIPKKQVINVHRMITINAVGVFLFHRLQSGLGYLETLDQFIQTYGLSYNQAKHDLNIFLKQLKDHGILDDSISIQ